MINNTITKNIAPKYFIDIIIYMEINNNGYIVLKNVLNQNELKNILLYKYKNFNTLSKITEKNIKDLQNDTTETIFDPETYNTIHDNLDTQQRYRNDTSDKIEETKTHMERIKNIMESIDPIVEEYKIRVNKTQMKPGLISGFIFAFLIASGSPPFSSNAKSSSANASLSKSFLLIRPIFLEISAFSLVDLLLLGSTPLIMLNPFLIIAAIIFYLFS